MGCDIHLYREKKIGGQWVTADSPWLDPYDEGWFDVPSERRFNRRDYYLFGFLVDGVRGEYEIAYKGRGLPFDVCQEVRECSIGWGVDGHSHSHLYLSELKDAWKFLEDKTIKVSGMKRRDELQKLQASIESDGETNWSLLYPYCEGAYSDNYERFQVEVPAPLILYGVMEIIDSFDGIDGENHRIVFWFDN